MPHRESFLGQSKSTMPNDRAGRSATCNRQNAAHRSLPHCAANCSASACSFGAPVINTSASSFAALKLLARLKRSITSVMQATLRYDCSVLYTRLDRCDQPGVSLHAGGIIKPEC